MHRAALALSVLVLVTSTTTLSIRAATVLITEIHYHPDEEDERGEFIELWNAGSDAVDIGGWKLAGGVTYALPAGTRLDRDERIVLARDLERFQTVHGQQVRALGPFQGELRNNGETIELLDAAGKTVDAAAYSDAPPWPASADGNGSSLERLSPESPAREAEHWAPSPPPAERSGPAGTPGRPTATWFSRLPPVIALVDWNPRAPRPGEPVRVEAALRHAGPVATVELLHSIAREGSESDPARTVMEPVPQRPGRFAATIPGQEALRLIRFRVVARDEAGAERSSPSPNDLRPTYSTFVAPTVAASKVPHAYLMHVNAAELAQPQSQTGGPGPGGLGFERPRLERKLGLAAVWGLFLADEGLALDKLTQLRDVLRAEAAVRKESIDTILKSDGLAEKATQGYTDEIAAADARLEKALRPHLSAAQLKQALAARKETARSRRGGFGIEQFVKESTGLDGTAYFLAAEVDLDAAALAEARRTFTALRAEERQAIAAITKAMQAGEDPMTAMGETVLSLSGKIVGELDKLLGKEDRQRFARWRARNVQSPFGGRGGPQSDGPPRGNAAFCLVDTDGRVDLYDHIQAPSRTGGFKVKLHGDRPLRFTDPFLGKEVSLRTANLVHEYQPRFILAEALAYDLYRRCGVPTPATGHVRLWVDGQALGPHLVVEQPNRAFLRRHGRDDRGNLYKILWYGREVVEQHEKKTYATPGHEDLLELLKGLDAVRGEEQWRLIDSQFNVDEVIGYFAASLCLSNWDGFFNNYFAYHDLKGSGKWEVYPWDEDKTWGFYDALPPDEVFFDMPVDYGADGAAPPGGEPQGGPGQRGQFRGPRAGISWWRPPGYFSGPFLANEMVRARYLRSLREILERHYTEEVYLPVIAALEERLLPEVRAHAETAGEPSAAAEERFRTDMESLRKHLRERRRFLLEQKELRGL